MGTLSSTTNPQYFPGTSTTLNNNTLLTAAPSAEVYCGLFKSTQGPLSYTYTSSSQLNSLCGPENPNTTVGLSSVYDLLTQSQNVVGLRVTHPYVGTLSLTDPQSFDSYAYVIYDNTKGWVQPVPDDYIGTDPQDFVFNEDGLSTNQVFMVYSIGPGSYYNNVSISLTVSPTQSSQATGYNLTVYDANGVLQEQFYVTFDITANGIDASTFAEAVVNGNSNYIGVVVNYIDNPGGNINIAYYQQYSPVSSSATSIFTYSGLGTQKSTSFTNFNQVTDSLGNIYTLGGSNNKSVGATVTSTPNYSIVQYNPANNNYYTLSNGNNSFTSNFAFSANTAISHNSASVYSKVAGGSIYYFKNSGAIDYLTPTYPATGATLLPGSTTLATVPSIFAISYTNAFANCQIEISSTGSPVTAWTLTIDGNIVVADITILSGGGFTANTTYTYSAGGLTFNYINLTKGAITTTSSGTFSFSTNQLHAFNYSLNAFSWSDLGPVISSLGQTLAQVINPISAITLPSGNIFLLAQVQSGSGVTAYIYNVTSNSLVYSASTNAWNIPLSPGSISGTEIYNQLFYYNGSLYLTGGQYNSGALLDNNLYLLNVLESTLTNGTSSISSSSYSIANSTMPSGATYNLSLLEVIGSTLQVYGGGSLASATINPIDNFSIYNFTTGTWTTATTISGKDYASVVYSAINYTYPATYTVTNGGTGYDSGGSATYTNVAVTYVSGPTMLVYPTATVTVASGVVTGIVIGSTLGNTTTPSISTVLTISNALLGGSGSGLLFSPATFSTVTTYSASPFIAAGSIATQTNSLVGILGSNLVVDTASAFEIYNGSIGVSNSLLGTVNLALGHDSIAVSDSDFINTVDLLYNKVTYPNINVIADCGFNDASESIALNNLMTTRQDGIALISMPEAFERNANSAYTYRQSLNINNGYSAIFTPGQYVRINTFTGDYQLFPISGAIGALLAYNDITYGIYQAPFGPSYGQCQIILKLPPQNSSTPLTIPYTQISYDESESVLLGSGQVNTVGTYSSIYPGIYLQNNLLLTSTYSLLQQMQIFRTLEQIQIECGNMGWKYLGRRINNTLLNQATSDYSNLLQQYVSDTALYTFSVICDTTNNTSQTIANGLLIVTITVYPENSVRGVQITITASNLNNSVSLSSTQIV